MQSFTMESILMDVLSTIYGIILVVYGDFLMGSIYGEYVCMFMYVCMCMYVCICGQICLYILVLYVKWIHDGKKQKTYKICAHIYI